VVRAIHREPNAGSAGGKLGGERMGFEGRQVAFFCTFESLKKVWQFERRAVFKNSINEI
jgi:hypothetical protein